MSEIIPITVARGDGIGPEIMDAVLFVLNEAGAGLEYDHIEIGESVYRRGVPSGIDTSAWDSLRRTQVILKAPITTPQGGGFKSLNVTLRTALGLFANVRPCVSYHPYIKTRHHNMDVVIVRENEEDLYTGIEHRQTDDVVQSIKLISRPGSERIIRYAFEYARINHRRKVTAFVKDNIMKLTDGLFHRVFDEVAAEYPEIQSDHLIVDIGAARLADTPENFDVIVTLNLYGDIISDIAAQIAGSVGLAGSSNIGDHCAMFEAIHGSAPTIAGQGIANPSGLLAAAIMMLVHLGKGDVATVVHNAWLRTLEDGTHTADIFSRGISRQRVTTMAFAEAVVARLGERPQNLEPVGYAKAPRTVGSGVTIAPFKPAHKDLVGVDVFVHWRGGSPEAFHRLIEPLTGERLVLDMISNRGTKVWPGGHDETYCTDHWRVRFLGRGGEIQGNLVTHRDIIDLLERFQQAGIDFIEVMNLCNFDGKAGFSAAQGQ